MATRMQQRRGTASQWTTANPILATGEIGYETDTNKFKIGDGVNTWSSLDYFADINSTINPSFGSSITFEGTTADAYETTLQVVDPTADRTITLPNATGTVVLADGSGNVTVSGDLTVNGTTTNINSTNLVIEDKNVILGDTDSPTDTTADGGGITLKGSTDKTINWVNSTDSWTSSENIDLASGKNYYKNGTDIKDVSETLTNKTISYSDNTITVQVSNVSDLTATASELNILDGATLTTTELNYVDGVTSSIQTQLDSKLASADLAEAARDAIGSALTAGTGITITPDDNGDTITVAVTANTYDAYGAASTAASNASSALTSHENDTTNIHGIADTSALATKTYADTAVSNHEADTTSVHGISDTSKLVTTDDSGTVTSTMIANGTIVNADINASAAIALSKLATDPLARANHTGTQTASTISDFDTQVRTSRLDQMANPTTSVSLNTQKIINLKDPDDAQDAATKAYVDSATAGLNVHEAVRVATTANVNLNNGLENGDTIDGITLATGNRVLVKNQNTAADNGVYVVQNNGAAVRATDYDSTPEVDAGDFIFVQAGTVNGKTGWVQTNTITTIGSDPIAFTQFSGAGTYLAGTGLTLTGNTFSIDTGTTVDLSTAQTLTNKTLTSPTITGTGSIAGTFTGNITGNVTGNVSGNAGTVTNGVYTTDTGTVTNTMLAGSIANAKLTNSSVTVGTTAISLGSSSTSLAGITTINSTTIPTSKTLVVTTDKLSVHAATTSSELAGVISDETGTGALVFANSPTLVTPALGTPSSATLTNATGLPVSTGISGLGTGIATALAVNVGSSGAPVINGGVLGTPSSGTLTNATGLPLTTGVTGTLPIANGGTGATTAMTAATALLPSQTGNSGKYLTNDGSGTLSWATVSGYSAPTLGSTSIASGATVTTISGLTLSGATLTGSLTAGGSTGTNGYYLKSTGTGVQWAAVASGGAAFSELMLIGA